MRGAHPSFYLFQSVCEAGLGCSERNAQDVGNLLETLVAIVPQSDDLGLFIGNLRQQAVDALIFLLEVLGFSRNRLGLSVKGNNRHTFGFTLTADAKVGQRAIEIGRQVLDFLVVLTQSLVHLDEDILHSILGIVDISQSVAGVL